MSAWKGLLLKEFYLLRNSLLIALALLILSFIVAPLLSVRFNEPQILLSSAVMLGGAHFLYLPLFLLISLHAETKHMHLWLHNPQSMFKLILSKYVVVFAGMLISLILTGMYIAYVLAQFPESIQFSFDVVISAGMLIAGSIYLSIFLLLWWAVYYTFRPIIGKWSWLIVGLTVFLPSWLLDKIERTRLFLTITEWGEIPLTGFFAENNLTLHVGLIVFYILVSVAVFVISIWLIDRKVEV